MDSTLIAGHRRARSNRTLHTAPAAPAALHLYGRRSHLSLQRASVFRRTVMLMSGLLFSPVQPLPKRAKRPPWALRIAEDLSCDPNGRGTANTNTNEPSARSPRSRLLGLNPHKIPGHAPELAPASFSASSSPSDSPLDSNASEYTPRLLRRRHRPFRRSPDYNFSNASVRSVVEPIVERQAPLPASDEGRYRGYDEYGGRDQRRAPQRCSSSTRICRVCASLAVLALIGIVFLARLVLLSKLSRLSNGDASAMKLKPAATSSPVHDTLQNFPGPRKHDADRSEDVTDQFQADGFAFVGTRRGFPIPQNDADRRSEAAAMNPQDGFRGSTREEEQTPDNVRVNERQQSQVNMVGGNRGIPSVLGEAQLVTEETQVPTTVAVENKRAHQSTPGETQQTAADLPVLPVRVPRLHAGFESIQPVAIEERSPREDQCWIFMYMEGGGGATVRSIVTDHWRRNEVMFDNVQWRRGDGYASDVMTRSHWQLLHGGCVESLRRYADKKRCRWFTVFRHPVARLLSAFEHCRNAPQDPLCASASSATGDLATFAEHWGNFGLMQFAMSVVSSNAVKKWAGSNNLGRGVSVWRLLKGYLDQDGVGRHGVARDGVAPAGVAQGKAAQSRVTEGGFAQGEALERLLEPAKELLRTQYAAVGIASELNTTMLLFDKALAMPGLNWSSALKRKTAAEGVPGSARDSPAGKGAMAEREAMANPRIGAALRLDILLYDHAVRVFHEQVRHYGID